MSANPETLDAIAEHLRDATKMVCDTPEPLAAILAEMRDERIIHIEDADATRCLLRNLADRIEAAVELELSKNRPNNGSKIGQFDNAAAMRAALEQALAYCESDQKSGIAYSDNDVLVPMLRAALAAPARNCDRFKTEREAFAFYLDHTPDNGNIIDGFPPWLFATEAVYGDAAPAEGGAE